MFFNVLQPVVLKAASQTTDHTNLLLANDLIFGERDLPPSTWKLWSINQTVHVINKWSQISEAVIVPVLGFK